MDQLRIEKEILQHWEEFNTFQKSLDKSEHNTEFVFYDGPPFATGLPHYGHLLASILKDIIPRYKTQNNFHVKRRWGWDTHGLPIEYEIEKELGIKSYQEILDFGIKEYNEECKKIVFKCKKEWEVTINRIGRWVDFKNDYKTMDLNFMESVWSVFNTLFEKKLIYRGFKVMPYSTGCHTPLSNFEANSNYKLVKDPSLVLQLPIYNSILENTTVNVLVWTTTPWTLPSNLALCVHPNLDYTILNSNGILYLVGNSRKDIYFQEYQIIKTLKGSDLKGIKYTPLYPYYHQEYKNAFVITNDNFVSVESGTGVVHMAPTFGEDDYRICVDNSIITKGCIPNPIDENGTFRSTIEQFKGLYIKDADKIIVEDLNKRGEVFLFKMEEHNYPFCWRSETPLVYKAVSSWFVNVVDIKDKIIHNNKKINWVPEHVGGARFHNWLESAQDWCISRNRFWGTPIPLWVSDDGEEIVSVDSIKTLSELSGIDINSIKDLHKDSIDGITIPSKQGKGLLRRIPEVFDCWFESGSVPYGQVHYPFDVNDEFIERNFPADFIAEGLDQTRGWFYTLMVLSTALFDKPAFKNVIVNGLILAEDGSKMSKRKRNYPKPEVVLDKYGADALRLYLTSTPVVRSEPMKFNEGEIYQKVKEILIPINNLYQLFKQMVELFNQNSHKVFSPIELDKLIELSSMEEWILQKMQVFINDIHTDMEKYKLYNIPSMIQKYIDDLSKGYVNGCKMLMKTVNDYDSDISIRYISVYYHCLNSLVVMIAPFVPFISDYIYMNMKSLIKGVKWENLDSVHLQIMPRKLYSINNEFLNRMKYLFRIVDLGRQLRTSKSLSFRLPIKEIIIIHKDLHLLELMDLNLIKSQLNVLTVKMERSETKYVTHKVTPNYSSVGPLFKQDTKKVMKIINTLDPNEEELLRKDSDITIDGFKITPSCVTFEKDLLEEYRDKFYYASDGDITIIINYELNDNVLNEYYRSLINTQIQKIRKECNLQLTDSIEVFYNYNASDDKINIDELINKLLINNTKLVKIEDIKEKINKKIIEIVNCQLTLGI